MDKRFGEMRADMDKRLGDLRADMEKRFGELRAGMEKRFGEVGQRLGELRAEMEKHAKESVERENRMLRAINAQTKWMIATAFTVVGLVFVMLRYVGPATGAG